MPTKRRPSTTPAERIRAEALRAIFQELTILAEAARGAHQAASSADAGDLMDWGPHQDRALAPNRQRSPLDRLSLPARVPPPGRLHCA